MNTVEMINEYGHERVAFFQNEKAGLKAIIAVHSTKLGNAVGGCRLYPYQTFDAALFDVLRLSRGMSFKNAAAGLPIGGGKGVIIADPSQKTQALFEAYGEAVESLGGIYNTAEDVNTTTQDMDWVMNKTQYVVGRASVSGDPSPFTAIGTFDGIRATAKFCLGTDDLKGVKIALQGLGHVGFDLAGQLAAAGAELIVSTHSNRKNMQYALDNWGAKEVSDEEIYATECDILSPCAMGATLNYDTIPSLKCKAVAGAANNQLLDEECGRMLKARGIAYAPDFIINGGGVINAGQEAFTTYDKENVLKQVHNIYNTVWNILEESKETGVPEGVIAQKFAEDRIKNGL
ncbi:MAG: leucine dehydrogenase [Lachnospiraceae bacterium]|nr:leucine dehydrogenase [Lachnospiraceae bacterium]